MIAVADWLVTMRDSSIAVAAIAGALVTLAAAARLPLIRIPVRFIGRALFGPAGDAIRRMVREEAGRAVNPDMVAMAERLGSLGATLSATRDEAAEMRVELIDIRARLAHIEGSCSALPHIEARARDIARHTGTDRRSEDP